MLVFPQLSTGCIAQFPIKRRQSQRTYANESLDGRQIRVPDPDASTVRWELKLLGLTDIEKQRIEDLFVAAEGRLRSFAFVDPTANLLAQTQDLLAAAWLHGPLLQMARGVTDPFGGDAGWSLSNNGASPAELSQTISCPSGIRYCFSVYARSSGTAGAECTLLIREAQRETTQCERISTHWRRIHAGGILPSTSEPVTFVVQTAAGSSIELFGPQVDAQPFPSAYKPSISGGVYLNTRFEEDTLQVQTEGINNHTLSLRLFSRAIR